MGNRAVITTPKRELGLYVHWNGGRDTIEPLLKYCELKGYRPPSEDSYGWARMCQVLGNFFGGTLSVGIDAYSNDNWMNPGDNGIYVIDGWSITDRIHPYEGFEEQQEYDFNEMLHAFDDAMPESERIGEYLDSPEIPIEDVCLGDEVWMFDVEGRPHAYQVVGFGQPKGNRIAVMVDNGDGTKEYTYPDRPYVDLFDHDGDYSWNCNNYPKGETCRIRRRAEHSEEG